MVRKRGKVGEFLVSMSKTFFFLFRLGEVCTVMRCLKFGVERGKYGVGLWGRRVRILIRILIRRRFGSVFRLRR